jgi:anaerobic selenocysteine-containing dehydrogenase
MLITLQTACPLDCPDTCTLHVGVDDGRLISVDAAPEGVGNPFTQGYICQKVKHHPRRVYAPERVLTPLVRSGPKGSGRFEPASWSTALDLIAERIRSAHEARGADAVIPYLYNSSAGVFASSAITNHVAARMGWPVVDHTICAGTAGAAWKQVFGHMLSADPLDVPHARLVVIWGANPTVSNTHLLPLITKAKAAGATLVVIDPRRTGVAARADLHLALKPGTDVVLAYAVANRLSELGRVHDDVATRATGVDEFLAAAAEWSVERAAAECDLDVGDVEQLVQLAATDEPAMLRMGWGLERNRNGGSSYVAAISTWLLAGHVGRRGSGIITSTGGATPLDLRRLWPSGVDHPAPRHVSMNDVGLMLCGELDGWQVPAVLIVQGANPAVTAVDQGHMLDGLARDDVFTVVHDQVLTDTARYADVVLPATTHFEAADLAGSYGSYTMQPVAQVIDRVGESWTNDEVGAALGARLGLPLDELDPDPARLVALLSTDGRGNDDRRLRPEGGTVQFVDTFPSYDGRARLHSPTSELPLPRYKRLESTFPLTLISPATNRLINSMFGESDPPDVVISMHPNDASSRGLVDGQRVKVFNEQGAIHLPVRLDASMRPGLCSIPKGVWLRDYEDGRSVNLLVPGTASDLAAGACFNDTRVEVAGLG